MSNRPLTRVPTFAGLADWQAIEHLFSKAGMSPPPTRLRDELVGILQWARFGQEVSDRADSVLSARSARPTYGDTHYET
jgi:hypothetical protein